MRYFYEKAPQYAVIAAGSLLEFALQKISFPVGRVDLLYLYPLTFREFLGASNRHMLVEHIPDLSVNSSCHIESFALEPLSKALDQYLMIGGMPEVVSRFVETKSMLDVIRVQNTLIKTMTDDTTKYARGDKQLENIAHVLRRIPKFIGQEITYTSLGEEDSHQRTKKSLEMLSLAKICSYVVSASPASFPLSAEMNTKHFKCIFLDVGLACRLLSSGANYPSTSEMDEGVVGKLCEQFVGQELLAHSSDPLFQLTCWIRPQRTAKAEVDYLISRHGKNVAVEVKNSSFAKLKSLQVLLTEYPGIEKSYVLSRHMEVSERGKITRVPLFCKV